MREFRLTQRIIFHSCAVARVAVFISKNFKPNKRIRKDIIERAALLHDLDKIRTLTEQDQHGTIGGRYLLKKGYRTISRIVNSASITHYKRLRTLEQKIVAYADKRVRERKVVSLDKRFAYFAQRYGTNKTAEGRKSMKYYYALEKELFERIPFMPDELQTKIKKEPQIRLE